MLTRHTRGRFARFVVVGGVGFLLQTGSVKLLKQVLPPRIAFTIGFVLAVISHYSFNRFWALTSTRRDSTRQALEYLATVGISYLVQYSAFNICLYAFGLSPVWSTAMAVPPSTIVVFLLLNYRVFKRA